MCFDAVNLTPLIDAVNFSLTLADTPSMLKSLTLAVSPPSFGVFSVMRHFSECADRQLAKNLLMFLSNTRKILWFYARP